jgi:CRISPR/Cas system-associated exonuclease Cas4 (RecB family)
MELFSFSRLSLYHTCPKRWYYKYVVKLDDPAGAPAILGKTVHKAVELVLNGRSFDEAVLAAIANEGDSTVDKSIVESMTKTALAYGYKGSTEQHFVMVLAKGIRVQGYIDVIVYNGQIPTIVDWKSGFKLYKVLDSWQLPLYAAAVMEQRGIETVKGVLSFLRFNTTRTTLIGRKEASLAKAWAIQIAEEIQERLDLLAIFEPNEIFPAKPSPACRNCPWCVRCLMEDKGGMKVC